MASPSLLAAQDTAAKQLKAEIVKKADKLVGALYEPRTGETLRPFDQKILLGPDDSVVYRYGTSYVAKLVFATDGSLARMELFPEVLLYSDSWSAVGEGLALAPGQMQWLIDTASELQPLGQPVMKQGCFLSGANHYCRDDYERALVSHYWREMYVSKKGPGQVLLQTVGIAYKKIVSGVVVETRSVDDQCQVKIGPLWYQISQMDDDGVFPNTGKGSVVQLVTFGCSGNEKVCRANVVSPEK